MHAIGRCGRFPQASGRPRARRLQCAVQILCECPGEICQGSSDAKSIAAGNSSARMFIMSDGCQQARTHRSRQDGYNAGQDHIACRSRMARARLRMRTKKVVFIETAIDRRGAGRCIEVYLLGSTVRSMSAQKSLNEFAAHSIAVHQSATAAMLLGMMPSARKITSKTSWAVADGRQACSPLGNLTRSADR